MSSNIQVRIVNDTTGRVEQSFRELKEVVSNAAVRDSLNVALNPVMNAYRQNLAALNHSQPALRRDKITGDVVPRDRIQFEVGKKVWKFPDGSGYAGLVGTLSGRAPHAHLVESGTTARIRLPMTGFSSVTNLLKTGTGGLKHGIQGKFLWVEIAMQKGWLPLSNANGPRRRTGIMLGTHPLARAASAGASASQAVFSTEFARRLNEKMVAG